jgi:hypothetical protein
MMFEVKTGLVTTPFNTISKAMTSHRAAQAAIYADQLQETGNRRITLNVAGPMYKSDLNEFDELYVYHGNDWSGAINLFGGVKNYAGIGNFVNFSKFKGKVYSLAIDMPDYYGMMKERLGKSDEYNSEWDNTDWDNLKRMCETAETVHTNNVSNTQNVSIGDSHAISMYRPEWKNVSVPFKTLHGALKEGLDSFLPKRDSWRTIEVYFGNIDVRHHLCRQPDPFKAVEDLVDEYIRQAISLTIRYGCTVKIYELLPIENESRSVPKTGWYKHTPFYGSWEERNNVRKYFKDYLKQQIKEATASYNYRIEIYEWVGKMINSKGELDFDCMEKPKSVHLSRSWYPHWQGYEWSHAPLIDYEPTAEKEMQEEFGLSGFL